MDITIGMKGQAENIVEREDTALEVGSGSLLVYATPCMVALMEGAACEAISAALPEGKTSVGIELSIAHLAATPVGLEVRAEAEVIAVEKNIVTFAIAAYDEAGQIGKGTHKRAVVTTQSFLEKTYSKL
jgi:predicted thioesterase